ncbi:MAG: alanine--tRNA ligase, partial [Bacteroidetes bacterium]|nr:alanine--tRNA ligase [Bacteroidota bacterium]
MNSSQIREAFFDFFRSKQHYIVPSAPMVIKNDPTLMFTNAGMNQFKDIFLGNSPARHVRVANTQKCLRVSGKHNDLEEVGHDTYHHTMFEMLGNWSFGDYFKEEAIRWSVEFLVDVLGIPKDRIYATIFEGSREENLERDNEAYLQWKEILDEDRILEGTKKDNFWEMGDTGPCGPCSEIHIDLRPDEEIRKINDREMINKDHPLVIELWNLVFIQYNRKANGELEPLPNKHVDTGLGFERLAMAVQGKRSNYETDIFQPLISKISRISGKSYGKENESDVAMRVVADHLRAVSFSIADAQLPSNNKAGYVIRRILRRAIRYGYTFLQQSEPFIYKLVPVLVNTMGDYFTELKSQKEIITKVIREEEISFLKTLETGIGLLEKIIDNIKSKNQTIVPGKIAFELYDTYGFPYDLTDLILGEHELSADHKEFEKEMKAQKDRSKKAATIEAGDWIELKKMEQQKFLGYNRLESEILITRYRQIKTKKDLYHLIFNNTPFYAEAGGQVGDTGYIESADQKIPIIDTIKENNLIIHITKELPRNTAEKFNAVVDSEKRELTANNHTATHLLHYALRKVLGDHVEQKGSLVTPDHLRFDFSHFRKVSDKELIKIESIVNNLIRSNLVREERTDITMDEAADIGAIALFGEKYRDLVRVIKFGDSVELCGGIHVNATGQIGFFKIISEGTVAAGIRRIEAITALRAENYINEQLRILKEITKQIKGSRDILQDINTLIKDNSQLNKKLEKLHKGRLQIQKKYLHSKSIRINDMEVIAEEIEIQSTDALKDLCFQLRNEIPDLFLVLGAEINKKAHLAIMISKTLVEEKQLNAGSIIAEIAGEIKGGGGGQPFFATAGGT